MTYYKFTTVMGDTADSPNPYSAQTLGRPPQGEEINLCSDWGYRHRKSVSLNGHWKPESAFNYATKRGWKHVSMTHHVSDMSGKGRGSEQEFRFDETGACFPKLARDVDDSADVHALWDEVEA